MKKKILVTDDNRDLAKMITAFLTPLGYDIRMTHDGASALRIISDDRPDLLIIDVMMPIMDGYSVCRTLVEEPQYEPVPKIIVMTSRNEDRDERIAKMFGADIFINKPVNFSELAGKVKDLLGS